MATPRADVVKDDSGSFIPASQRPDGTWRKPIRVKEGYVPQEEVPLYESKGKQWAKSKPAYPVGMSASVAQSLQAERSQRSANNPIPGLTINPDEALKKKKNKKKPASTTNEVKVITESLSKTQLNWPGKEAGSSKKPVEAPDLTAAADPAKKLKNMKKKLRDIEALEQKVKSGQVKPDKDQVEKMSRKNELVKQISSLEAELAT